MSAYQAQQQLSTADLLTVADLNHDGAVTNADLQVLLNLLKTDGGIGAEAALTVADTVNVDIPSHRPAPQERGRFLIPLAALFAEPQNWLPMQGQELQTLSSRDASISSLRISPKGVDQLLATSSIHHRRALVGARSTSSRWRWFRRQTRR